MHSFPRVDQKRDESYPGRASGVVGPPSASSRVPNPPDASAALISERPLSISSFRRGKSSTRRTRAVLKARAASAVVHSNGSKPSSRSAFSSGIDDDDSDDDVVKLGAKRKNSLFRPDGDAYSIERSGTKDEVASDAPLDTPANVNERSLDPLDTFMATLSSQNTPKRPRRMEPDTTALVGDKTPEHPSDAENEQPAVARPGKRSVYQKIDHSCMDYHPFERNLYIEVPEISKMSDEDVAALRIRLGNIRVRGRRCPNPIISWAQCGLSTAVLNVLNRHSFQTPTPIQAQAIPCIMSGRDVIGIARTGSGKTLAFVLPILRHVARQSRANAGDGPSALIIAPTRELAIQIFGDAKKFSRAVDVRCVCAYGGSGVKDQIAELKRGSDIVVCTPGRMIDLLAMNGGRITNLRRATFVVLDEADRMFDMGFEPQLTRIVENIRPDRQTVMFSATFPMRVEKLARKVLKQPLEITVGGNSVAAATIDQHVEVRSENSKFFRLLELLGTWYEKGSTLVFVDRQDNADRIFRELVKARYKCLSLHGGMDQADRDSTIVDFKNGDVRVLVATSVAARGLDVKNLTLVVNYDVPSHYEDYVHRVGRTGRAGKSGTAYTFITPEQEACAGDLVKALTSSAKAVAEQEASHGDKEGNAKAGEQRSRATVPPELIQLAESFELKRKSGVVKYGTSSGYGGRGFKFDENDEYDAAKNALRKMQAKQYGFEDFAGEDEEDEEREEGKHAAEDNSDKDDDDDDGIIEIASAIGLNSETTRGGSPPHTKTITKEALSAAEVGRLMDEAVKKAAAAADSRGLDVAGRSAFIAKAKANVLSMAAMRRKNASVARPDQPPELSRNLPVTAVSAAAAAAAAAAAISAKLGTNASGPDLIAVDNVAATEIVGESELASNQRFAAELEINDYPQHARWQVTRKNSLNDVEEFTGCVITTRGNFYPGGRNPPRGERKLHFLIEGPSRRAVKTARRDIRQKLEEAATVSRPSDNQYSKYSVV